MFVGGYCGLQTCNVNNNGHIYHCAFGRDGVSAIDTEAATPAIDTQGSNKLIKSTRAAGLTTPTITPGAGKQWRIQD